jgi:hypothetical protein
MNIKTILLSILYGFPSIVMAQKVTLFLDSFGLKNDVIQHQIN